jgi:hypothetical protein
MYARRLAHRFGDKTTDKQKWMMHHGERGQRGHIHSTFQTLRTGNMATPHDTFQDVLRKDEAV